MQCNPLPWGQLADRHNKEFCRPEQSKRHAPRFASEFQFILEALEVIRDNMSITTHNGRVITGGTGMTQVPSPKLRLLGLAGPATPGMHFLFSI